MPDGKTDEPHERRCIHTKGNLFGKPGIHQETNTFAGLRNDSVYFQRLFVSSASLDIAVKKVVCHSIQYGLGRLCSRGIIKEDKTIS